MGGVMRQSLASGILVVAVSMLVACGSSEPVSNDVTGGNGNEVDADFHNLKTPPLEAGQFELMTLSTLPDTVPGGDVRMAIRGLEPGESYMVTRKGTEVSGAFERVSDSEVKGVVRGHSDRKNKQQASRHK